MTVGELIDELKNYPDDMKVVFYNTCTTWVDGIKKVDMNRIDCLDGNDCNAVTLYSGKQYLFSWHKKTSVIEEK